MISFLISLGTSILHKISPKLIANVAGSFINKKIDNIKHDKKRLQQIAGLIKKIAAALEDDGEFSIDEIKNIVGAIIKLL